MSVVTLIGVNVVNNPARFTDKYELEITFECLEQLQKDLEWKLTYVGSANSDQYDQELDSLLVGPVPIGTNKFLFVADAPDIKRIPDSDILGVTVVLLSCSYDGREFVRVGYYVNNEYDDEQLVNDPPAKPIIEKIRRNILSEKPRVTRFAIKWDSEETAPAEFPPDQPEADLAPDEEEYGADELREELEEEKAAAAAELSGDKDADMAGVPATEAEGEHVPEEDEMSEDGSVDIEGESDDEIDDEEGEGEGEGAADGDEMDVDMDKPEGSHKSEVMAH